MASTRTKSSGGFHQSWYAIARSDEVRAGDVIGRDFLEGRAIVYRGENCFIILNTFPYTPGHVMVVPFSHLDELQKLPPETAHEMMDLSQKIERVLRHLYTPDGVNLGMNIGQAAGAGVAHHIHMHVLPRWVADANFISVVGETRILPESLDVTYKRIKLALESPVPS